jgi:acyl carrier protein
MLEMDAASIDPRQPFTYYGLGSVQAVSLTGDLEDFLNRKLAPTLAWDYPTIELLANFLANEHQPVKTQTPAPASTCFNIHQRTDCHRRDELPLPAGAESASLLGTAPQWRGCHQRSPVRPLGCGCLPFIRARAWKGHFSFGGFLDECGSVRSALLWDLPARSRAHGPAATPPS